jgi:hypothetical protein
MKEVMTKEEILKAIKECAKKMGRAPSLGELAKMKRVAKAAVYRKFGKYQNALEMCGLERTGPGYQTELRDVFLDWAKLARKLGKLPTMGDYEAHAKFSIQPLLRRYGIWAEVPAGMAEYIKEQKLEREWADVLVIIGRGRTSVRGKTPRPAPKRAKLREDEPVYGAALTLGPMAFAPTCENGVLFLFGSQAERLGFVVLKIQTKYPDCEAMREVRPGVLQRKRIEFELLSKNYIKHEHPRGGADIIVCWEHNWEDCPLEVIELKKVMEEMRGR